MSLPSGTRLGPYEIVSSLGAGGMGEVYRARDTNLGRDVAIKVLPEAFGADADRVARFEREARVLASLNHPNIAGIYGLERTAAATCLVMELAVGEALDARLKTRAPSATVGARGFSRATGLAVEDALHIASQIASALEAAHDKGIIHRDLKPANIVVSPDGKVKVLDFGLAKAIAGDSDADGGVTHQPDLTHSPTAYAGTMAGVILGTAAYMSPEQARGKVVDKRTDIWSFGCVLFELLTGKAPFGGETLTDIVAAVVKTEPDWAALPAEAPREIRTLLRRCLAKDLDERLHDIGDARLALADASAPEPGAIVRPADTRRTAVVPWIVAACAVAAVTALAWYLVRAPGEIQWSGTRLGGAEVSVNPRISPDGQLLAFQAMVDGIMQVAVMKPGTGNWTVLTRDRSRGSVGNISWSTDGAKLFYDRWLGTPTAILSIPVLGGDEQLVAEDAAGPQVLPDGSLVIARLNSERRFQLQRFWPETARVQPLRALTPLDAVALGTTFRATRRGDRVAFFGKPLDEPTATDHLYVMELSSEKISRLAPGASFGTGYGSYFPLAFTTDDRAALVDMPSDDTHRIVSVPLDGGPHRTLLTLTNHIGYFDVGSDGSIYLDQVDRPVEFIRMSPDGRTRERIGAVSSNHPDGQMALPLPDDRVVVNTRTGGRDHLLLLASGKDPVSFIETQEESAGPLALVGQTHVAFLIGPKGSRMIALASVADRRITRRLEGSKGAAIESMAASPDGKTIYFARSGSIWSIPIDGGEPIKVRSGESVTIDPYKQELIVRLTDRDGTRLVRHPIGGGEERPIGLAAGVRLAPIFDQSNAVGANGKMLAQVASSSIWFWPAALIDLETGRAEPVPVGYDADSGGGWTRGGQLVVHAIALHSTIWRFRPGRTASQ
jgi:eukaryotic-like serine/threonine-protein kinase